jgi:RHS repeat-associated protein
VSVISKKMFVLMAMSSLWSSHAHAQLAPTGAHYAGRPSDTGNEGPNEKGGYAASIPFDFPAARGGLPIPVQLSSGSRGFGAAGVGWDVPLSYVYVDDSFAHRRPTMAPGQLITPREKISVSLLGRSVEMLPQGSGWIGRYEPELSLQVADGVWTLRDGNGVTYTFTQDPLLSHTGGPYFTTSGMFLLQSIHGRGGASVALKYNIQPVFLPNSAYSSTTIDLAQVSYNPDSSGTCFKTDISLVYDGDLASPQSISVVGEATFVRFHKVVSVDVASRATCGDAAQRTEHYALTYALDPDTQQQRLASVRMFGRDGTPEASTSVPIAAYKYATATNASGVLQYGAPSTIPLPSGSSAVVASTPKVPSSLFQPPYADSGYAAVQSFTDLNGDGRPDFVFEANGKLSIARGLSGEAMSTPVPLNDNVMTRLVLDARSSTADRFTTESNLSTNEEFVWTQSIDVNGDGRIDIIDAAETPNTWVVYLNTPDPGPSGVKWVRRAYDVTNLRNYFQQSGLAVPATYVPLSHRSTGRTYGLWICWTLENGTYVEDVPSNCASPTQPPFRGPEQTFVDYEVRDINGDGYPDVVFNSSPIIYTGSGPPHGNEQHELSEQRMTFGPAVPNQIEVVFNVGGVFISSQATDPFSSPQVLTSGSTCGVEEWTSDPDSADRIQDATCTFADVNGDGLLDRVENNSIRLGTGFSFNTVTLNVPAGAARQFLAEQRSGYVDTCASNLHAPFASSQTVGLRDLNGDSIPDLVESNGTQFQMFAGTGAGFSDTPIAISGGFSFSTENEQCDGTGSYTTSGVYDVNGDGMPDVVQISGSNVSVYQLVGGDMTGNADAGRIVQVDNGYGAVTSISYASAKEDASTPHQVPFPELVATSVQTVGTANLGGTTATTHYAYGNISMFYDSTLDAFRTSGYSRRVEAVTFPADPTGAFSMNAKIIDSYPLDPADPVSFPFLTDAQRLGRYLQAGRVSDVTLLAGGSVDVWSLLLDDTTTDSRRIGGLHYSVDTTDTRFFADGAPPADLCKEIMFPYDFDLSKSNNYGGYNPCTARGFLFTRATESWRGTAAPPAAENVQIYTTVRSVDDYGRPTSMFYQNDASRDDDDFCVDTTYATPVDPATSILTAVYSRKVWACSDKSDARVLAEDSWEYDKQYPGLVSQGLPTSHTVYRHATDTGAYLNTIRKFDADYDALGNPFKVTSVREDGATRTTQIDYDSFGLAPVHTAVDGTNVPTLEASRTIDQVTNVILSETDENGTTRGRAFDGFGRPTVETIASVNANGILATHSYLGYDGTDPLGRRVVNNEYTDPVADVSSGTGTSSTLHFDELGRERYEESPLGADYAGETLISTARTYDLLGRVVFEAEPYTASQDPTVAYGTTRYYNLDGSPAAEIRGRGVQSLTATPDATVELFPTLYSHTFANHAETLQTQAADALTAGSLQFGVVRQAVTSAIGRVLSRSTVQNGTRVELATLGYDQLGQQSAFTRFQDPYNGANPVTTSWQFDSLGHVIHFAEPTSAPQDRTYSDWGQLESITWTPSLPEVPHSIVKAYDALGRLTYSEETNNGVVDSATVNKYAYDVAGSSPYVTPASVKGRLAIASSPTGSVTFGYDDYGQVSSRTFTDSNSVSYVEQQGFHGDGSQAWIQLQLPDNAYQPERLDYDYDTASRLRWMWFSDGVNTQELYNASQVDAWGRVRDARFGKAEYAANYAELGRRLPQGMEVKAAGGVRSIKYGTFDAFDRETTRDENIPNYVGHQSLTYDALGRLRTSSRTNGSTAVSQFSFNYDALGNVLQLADYLGTSGATLNYLSTDRDQICGISYTGTPTSCNVAYDSFGNIASEPTRAGSNKLKYFNSGDVRSISNQSGIAATFAYDPFGDVQDVKITSGATELRHDQHYGAFITQRSQAALHASTTYISRQFPGPGLTISRRGPQGSWVYEFGEASGTRFTTDQNGKFLQDIHYNPYGEATTSGAAAGSPTFTTDQWNDGDALDSLGLVTLGRRVYDPVIGRFLSRDPLLISRSSSTTNPYAFAMSDPANLSDPSGMDPCAGDPLCVWTSANDPDISNGTTAAVGALAAWAAGILNLTGGEPPMLASSKGDIANYGAEFDTQFNKVQNYSYLQVEDRWISPAEASAELDDFGLMSVNDVKGGAKGAATAVGTLASPEAVFVALMSQAKNHDETVLPILGYSTSIPEQPTQVNPLAGSARNINPLGGNENCVLCAIATDRMMAGEKNVTAELSGPLPMIETMNAYKPGVVGIPANGVSGIRTMMNDYGPGSRAIVWGTRGALRGHVFNVVNQGGEIRFIDGQAGRGASLTGYDGFYLFRTDDR